MPIRRLAAELVPNPDLVERLYDYGRCTFCLIRLDASAREDSDAAWVSGDTFENTPSECATARMCYVSCPEVDYSNRLADLSVSRAGSPAGFETVLVRTEAGLRALEGPTGGEYVPDWYAVFGREEPGTFVGKLLTVVEEMFLAKARPSRRVSRRKGRPLRFRA